MKKLLLLLIIPFLSFGQGWIQTFGGSTAFEQEGRSVQQTTDSGYIIAGHIAFDVDGQSNSEFDIYVIKTNESGEEQWSRILGDDGIDEYAHDIEQSEDGGYVICGTIGDEGFLIKLDENGDDQWVQYYMSGVGSNPQIVGSTAVYDLEQTTDGGYIIAGWTSSYSCAVGNEGGFQQPAPSNVYLVKVDENGQEEWEQCYGGESEDWAYDVEQTEDGGYIICGNTGSFGNGGRDIYCIKTDANGNEEWFQTYGGSGTEYGNSVEQVSDGGFIIAGHVDGDEILLVKTDEVGDEQWVQAFNNEANISLSRGNCVRQTVDGGYIVTGRSFVWNLEAGSMENNVCLLKSDEYGTQEWFQTVGEGGHEEGFSIRQTTDNGYIITGYQDLDPPITNTRYVYLIKTNEWGNITSTIELPIPTSKYLITTVDILGRETNNNKGFQLHIYDDGSVEKKYLIK